MNPWFTWRGKRYEALPVANYNFVIGCPICGDGIPCHGTPRDEMTLSHSVSVAADGAMTVSPSVVCPRNCGWHVVITNGVANG